MLGFFAAMMALSFMIDLFLSYDKCDNGSDFDYKEDLERKRWRYNDDDDW